ncbi:MAG: archease [Smithellaceae bacterium]|jgi:SHS2 domain-containing protein
MKHYKLLNHTADIGIEVWGKTKKELFASTVEAMFDLMVDLAGANSVNEKVVTVKGADIEDLLVNFLREALYLFNGKKWIIKQCKRLEMKSGQIVAQLQGEPYDSDKHQLKTEIKAVTYHDISVKKTNEGWRAKVIFDV